MTLVGARAVRGAGVVALTGAGISTSSGIPDFRGPTGVWTEHPELERLLEIDAYLTDPGVRREGWRAWAESPVWRAEPTPAHRALSRLEAAGRLGAVITQNFDGLHQSAGTSPARLAEVHGSLLTTSCLACGVSSPTPDVLARLTDEPDPRCDCGGVLKVDVVYFGEPLPPGAFDRAVRATRACEVFVAIGTTLTVQPVASLAVEAVRCGARLVIVNAEPTAYDRVANVLLRDPIDSVVPELVDELLGEESPTAEQGAAGGATI